MAYDKLRKIIENGKKIVFLGGAGVSTESGIPDFRGSGGLYSDKDGDMSPEDKLHRNYLRYQPEDFFEYYKNNMVYTDARPNAAHRFLANLEKAGKLTAVITQNIDGLHSLAGSENVIELHGSVNKNYCMKCGKKYSLDYVMNSVGVPYCKICGGVVRPDVVLYSEALDTSAIDMALEAICNADVLIVGGTSLTVNPAASMVRYFRGENFVIINKSPTPYDHLASLIIREPIGEVFDSLGI